MADGYNIKIGLDSRAAERGVKSFTSSLNASFKALREFDAKATNAFKALDQFGKMDVSNLNRSMRSVGAAVNQLNKIKINKALAGNLQTIGRALSGIRFSGNESLKKLPEALKALNAIKINPNVVSSLNGLKAATKGFSGPPKSLSEWPKNLSKLASVKISGSLATNLSALKTAMRGFVGPSKSAMNLPTFLKQVSQYRISPALATNLNNLKLAMTGFSGPSARSATNLAALLTAMKGASANQINQIAAALQRLNGIRINIGGLGGGGRGGLGGATNGVNNLTNAMRGLGSQTAIVNHAMHAFQAALGGLSLVSFIKGVYETGNAYQSLERTLGAVASSQEEVDNHMQFINDLTKRMPISIDAAAVSYKKFAVAARLSGMSIKDTQGVFGDFATGFSAMGLSVESQKYAFIALEQMISKGAIQMEELKTQLGDHLPGAVQILADSLDVPVAKLFKMIEAGEVTSDALIKMGKRVREQFEAASAAAKASSQGQFIELGNAWDRFKKTIFNNDFNAALGAMAGQLAAIFDSPDMQSFAADIGQAFGRLFKAISAVANLLANNRETVVTFMKAFVGYSAIVAVAGALRLLIAPALMLGPIFSTLTLATRGLAAAFMFMASGRALTAIKAFFSFFSKRIMFAVAGIAALGGSIYWLAQRMDKLTGTDLAAGMEGLGNTALDTAKSVISGLAGIGDSIFKEISDGMDASASDFDRRAKEIADANLTVEEVMRKNHEREMKRQAEQATALSNKEADLWKQINPIGAANEEYKTQLALLDEIAKKRGLTGEQTATFKKVLDAQTLDDRNPMGAAVRDMREELAAASAKTAEQRAFNDAKKFENDMLKKGVALNKEQVQVAEDYYKAIAKMNGELGNGFERWSATVGDFNDNVQEAVKDGIGSLSSEIAAFATGAEADFAKLGQSILQTFAKIALDGMIKDVLGAMGMDGEKNGKSAADAALEKLAGMGETINTAMTNVYTSGLTINGETLDGGLSPFTPQPVIPVERKELPLIPGTREMVGPSALNPLDASQRDGMTKLQDSATKAVNDAVTKSQPQTLTLDTSKMDYLVGPLNEKGQSTLGTVDLTSPVQQPMIQQPMPAIDTTTTGAVTPNHGQSLSLPAPDGNRDWLNQMYARGRSAGLPDTQARLMASQAALESGWGKSGLTKKANNFFGMKAGKSWTGDTVTMRTREEDRNGNSYYENAKFRKYGSMEEGLLDKERMMARNWPDAMKANSFSEATEGLKNGRFGAYATDTKYASKLQSINAKIDPNAYPIPPKDIPNVAQTPAVDPMVTSSITKANAELTKTGTTMQQLGTTVQQTGTAATSTSQQTQMASQQKTLASQTEAMSSQQAAMGMQQAGLTAQQAGPQFMQAGVQIGQAGQAAQTAGTNAATAQPGLGGFGSGIQSLLGPLSSAIPGLGQFGGAIMSLLSSLGGGGGAMGLFSEGGLSTQPVQTMKIPHFSEGTANTSGGMPAVLHPNEAVIPLSRGRKIPVEMPDDSRSGRQDNLDNGGGGGMNARPVVNFNITTPDPNAFRKSKRLLQMEAASVAQRTQQRQ